MRILVTGAAGFIGSHVTRSLVRAGHSVCALVRPEASIERLADCIPHIRVIRVDLREAKPVEEVVREAAPECAVHLAWYAAPGKYWTALENLDCVSMTLSLARSLARSGCARFVGVGSCAEYDWTGGVLSETSTPLKPRTLYGVSKNATRMLVEALCQRTSISFAWPRLFYLYGPGEDPSRLVPSVTLALLRGECARCTEGKQLRDFLHIDDVASAICAVAANDCRGVINIGSGAGVSVRTIVELIGKVVGRGDHISYGAVPGDPDGPPSLVADVRRLQQEVGWRPMYSIEDGLQHSVQWWKEHMSLADSRL